MEVFYNTDKINNYEAFPMKLLKDIQYVAGSGSLIFYHECKKGFMNVGIIEKAGEKVACEECEEVFDVSLKNLETMTRFQRFNQLRKL